jgi:hypothetical protein
MPVNLNLVMLVGEELDIDVLRLNKLQIELSGDSSLGHQIGQIAAIAIVPPASLGPLSSLQEFDKTWTRQ